jgi:hypothetical protein
MCCLHILGLRGSFHIKHMDGIMALDRIITP